MSVWQCRRTAAECERLKSYESLFRKKTGLPANDFLMQFQADILVRSVIRPKIIESTSLGAAYMAGLKSGFWEDSKELERIRSIEKEFTPSMDEDTRHSLLAGWRKALRQATLSPLL